MKLTKSIPVTISISVLLASSLLTGCGKTQAKCDDLISSLQYGAWSPSDSDWYDANCR